MCFLKVQLGEELLGQGDEEGGVEHLGNAVAVCGQPQQLLQVLQQTLPPHVFHLLLQRLPSVGQVNHHLQSQLIVSIIIIIPSYINFNI